MIDGKKVHYIEKGSGKPIILIHGFLYHTVMWKKNIDALAENNIKTIWFYDKRKVSKAYTKEVLQPLCIKGSYKGMMYILRNVLKEPYVEKEAKILAKMTKPILIIHGNEDKAVPVEKSKDLHNLWKGSRLEVFQKAGHSPHEEYPMKFNKLAMRFISE